MYNLLKTQVTYVQLFSHEKNQLQTSTNGSNKLTEHFKTENEWFILIIIIYLCIHKWTFNTNIRRLDRSCTDIVTYLK